MKVLFCICAMLVTSTLRAADPQADAKARLELFQTTSMVYVASFTGKPKDFVPDDDPGSIQFVPLTSKSQGKSHVSADGQVIFLRPDEERKTQKLIEEAFTKLLAAKNAGS